MKKPKPIRLVIGLPPWSRTRFDLYTSSAFEGESDARLRQYVKGAKANRWRHVQIVEIQPTQTGSDEK